MRISYYLLRSILICKLGITLVANAGEKTVALTFDDGPNPPYTEKLLQVLENKGIKATFFLIGQQVDKHPELTKKIIAAGHEVGGHSNDWKSLAFRPRKTVEAKLDKMDAAFMKAGVTNVALFRAPGGMLSPGQGKIFKERNLQVIGADVVVGDWKEISAEKIRDRVMKRVRSGSIIVLHDGGGDRSETIKAVPLIIGELRKKGYAFLQVSELLELQ